MIDFLNWFAYDVLWGLPLIVLMVVTGLYFTVRSGFFQFRYFGRIWRHTIGTLFHRNQDVGEGSEGMLSPFQHFKAKAAKEDNRKLRAMVNAQEDYYFLVNKTFEVRETNYFSRNQSEISEPLILGNVLHCKNAVEAGRCGHAGACKSCPIRFVINKSFERADDFSDLEACMEVYDGTNKLVDIDVMLDGHYITLSNEGHLVVNVKDTTNQKVDKKRPKVLFITANVALFEKVREALTPVYRVLNADNLHQARHRLLLASSYQFHAILTDEEFYLENKDILLLLVKNDNLSLYVFTNNELEPKVEQITCLNKDFEEKELLQLLSQNP